MDIPIKNCAWYTSTATRPNLQLMLETEYLVIGGGISGLSALLTLSHQGKTPILIDANEVGCGGTGNSTAIITEAAGSELTVQEMNRTFGEFATQNIFKYLEQGINQINSVLIKHPTLCDSNRGGYINLFRNTFHAQQEYNSHQNLSHECELITGNKLRYLVDTTFYTSGLLFKNPHKNYVFNPIDFSRILAKQSELQGATIYEHTPAIHIAPENDKVLVTTPLGLIVANKVIIATNPYLINQKGLPSSITRGVLPVYQYISSVKFNQSPFQNCSAFSDNESLGYLFGNVNQNEVMLSAGNFEFVAAKSPSKLDKAKTENASLIKTRFPGYEFEVQTTWGGRIGGSLTKGFLPQTGFIDYHKRVYVSFIGDGLAMANFLGDIAAQAVMGNDEIIPSEFAINRQHPISMRVARNIPQTLIDFIAPLIYRMK